MNLCPYGSINPHAQDLFSALVSSIQRVTSITPYVAVKVVSCMDMILFMEGIIQFEWGGLNLINSPNMKTVGLIL